MSLRRRRRLKGIHSRPDTNRMDQMLAVRSLSQHRVSSSKIVRPRAPCGARCIGHAVSTWSAVCSEAPHSQFSEGARPHLCMDEWNRPTYVLAKLGKQICIDNTYFNVIDGLYESCKLIFHGNRQSPGAQSLS